MIHNIPQNLGSLNVLKMLLRRRLVWKGGLVLSY